MAGSVTSATTLNPRMSVKPPDKGSFPLDHDGECKEFMTKYMLCLKTHKNENTNCRLESKDYLECRMNKNLMRREDWDVLGYQDLADKQKV